MSSALGKPISCGMIALFCFTPTPYATPPPCDEVIFVNTVSLLIRTLDRPAQLAEALESVRAQTYRPLEVIVVNDGGRPVEYVLSAKLGEQNDDTQAALRWRYHAHSKRQGRSVAANRALSLASGEWVIFLDDDDWIEPDHIERLVRVLKDDAARGGTLLAAYADTRCYRNGDALEAPFFARDFDPIALAEQNYLPIHAVLLARRAYEAGCRFSPQLSLYEDWHFWLQVARQGDMQRVPGATACYRLDISGVGGGHDIDYLPQYVAFLREALPVLSDKQLIHLHHAVRKLGQAQADLLQQQTHNQKLEQHIAVLEKSSLRWRLVRTAKRVARKGVTFADLLRHGDWHGIQQRLQRYLGRVGLDQVARRQRHLSKCQPGVDILCTRHTEFVARRIKVSLAQLGIAPVQIISDGSGASSKRLCIVVCPQMFTRMPRCYIALQMEQSVSSRWFNKSYISRLFNAMAVMDYSQTNLRYLQETAGLSHKYLYYTPISNLPPNELAAETAPSPEYVVAFYGDANTPRRQKFLQALEERFSVLRISEVFGESLYDQLRRAKVVVNIHYYEGALLETTRLYECLSLGLAVISETSVDMSEHTAIKSWVRFTPVDDVVAMADAVAAELDAQQMGNLPAAPEDDLANFHFYFTRMLVALGVVPPAVLDTLPMPIAPSLLSQGVGLSLPETHTRHAAFQRAHPGYPVFPGLRHHQGWRGCALSYRYLARRALEADLARLEVREDDALLDAAAAKRWAQASALFDASDDYDILSGLIADVAEHMTVLDAFSRDGEDYLVIDCMTSTVCNRYGHRAIRLLAEWPFADADDSNTVDRYLERQQVRVLVPLPFIATHRPDAQSTLWHFDNTTYDDMISASEAVLYQAFKRFQTP